ncbi:MAG: hypothetical protein EBZ83_01895, partial [Verrucomicrobia bacterium]|nr:hypothetical protein [Verrucomicrobiota bacterium]NDF17078.1 hypothetical protein [Verrucomicrobiota bacterium]
KFSLPDQAENLGLGPVNLPRRYSAGVSGGKFPHKDRCTRYCRRIFLPGTVDFPPFQAIDLAETCLQGQPAAFPCKTRPSTWAEKETGRPSDGHAEFQDRLEQKFLLLFPENYLLEYGNSPR